MCNCCGSKCTVMVLVTTSSGQLTLPETNRITNGVVKGIGMRRLNGVAATANNGTTLAVDAVVMSAHLSLKTSNGTEVLAIPMQYLQRDFNSPEWMKVNNLENIDLTQSTVVLNTGAAGYLATSVLEILFEIDCDGCGIPVNTKRK